MSTPQAGKERPMSPFMIGPYYKPQLTSMLSITHRGTGVFLAFGAFLLAWWLMAAASGPERYAQFVECARHPLGMLVLAGLAFSLIYHWLNGIRHLFWDIGWGFQIDKTYASGWAVLVLSLLGTAGFLAAAFGGAP